MTKTVTTVTKTKKKAPGTSRVSRGVRKSKNTTTVVTQVSKPSKQAKRRFSTLLGITDSLAMASTDKLLHSLYVGTNGISRGIAFGSDMTGLTKIRGALDIFPPVNGRLNLAFCPVLLNSADFIHYNYGSAAALDALPAPYSPWQSGAGSTLASSPGPFATTNPSLGWRIVRATLRLSPSNTALNQGGWAIACNNPILYTGAPGSGAYSGPLVLSDFENVAMQRTFTGLESIHYSWFPNQSERDLVSTAAYSVVSAQTWSGLEISINTPVSVAESYHVEWEVGVEYAVNNTFKPFVERALPTLHPDALYHMNQFTSKHWIPAVLSTVPENEALIETMDPIAHEYMGAFHMNNKMGRPSDYAIQSLYEEEKMIGTPKRGRDAYEVITDACGTAEQLFGINPCHVAGKAGLNYAASRVGNALRGNNHLPLTLGY